MGLVPQYKLASLGSVATFNEVNALVERSKNVTETGSFATSIEAILLKPNFIDVNFVKGDRSGTEVNALLLAISCVKFVSVEILGDNV